MTVRKLIITACLLLTAPAFAELVTVINAVETAPKNIILPGETTGMMTFKACDDVCEDVPYERVQLTPNTNYKVDGKTVRFVDFRREFSLIKRGQDSYALVTYETATNTVTSLEIAR